MTPTDRDALDRGSTAGQDAADKLAGAGFEHLRLERDDRIVRLVLDRPPLNVLTIDMLWEVAAAADLVAEDPDVSVLAITGEGRAFCAGVDVADHTEDRVDEMIRVFHEALLRLRALELPVIAVVNGAALGGGLELALACDIIVARSGARLGQPEILLGVLPPFAAAVLPGLVGRARAMDICLTGRTFLGDEAKNMGLVQHVWPDDDFPRAAEEYVRSLSQLSRPVLRMTKRAVVAGAEGPLKDALPVVERIYLDELMRLEDAREGLTAFLEKRPPVWKGR
jgi:cyclohexa-1,5-dienecarbonyl-CoA hydratase